MKKLIMLFIVIYAISTCMKLAVNFIGYFGRNVPVESRQPGGVLMINGNKFLSPSFTQQRLINLRADNAIDFLFLSAGERSECVGGLIIQLSLCILHEAFLWTFDELNPFKINYTQLKLFLTITSLVIILFACNCIKDAYTESVVRAATYRPNSQGDWIFATHYWDEFVKTALVFYAMLYYLKAVRNKRELDLTI